MINAGQCHKRSKANIVIYLYFIIFASGIFLLNIKFVDSNNMERKTILIPIGAIEGWVLETDRKSSSFCSRCQARLEKSIK